MDIPITEATEVTEVAKATEVTDATEAPEATKNNLIDVNINKDENIALNLMVSFLGLAQRRGSFTLDEAAKIYECIEVFKKK